MKGHIRNIFPGGNTPQGFYSYYNDILPQRKAEKIFCIKGGPGTGKSTLMKGVGRHFSEQGEDVDYLWCSSDPDSLDGVVLRKRNVVLLDGTAPHIVDPKNPGAVDEILNLGAYWDEEGIRSRREEIIACNEKTAAMFQMVYGYLAAAGKRSEFLSDVLQRMTGEEGIFDAKQILQTKLSSVLAVRRTESRRNRDSALGGPQRPGHEKRAFAGAITPDGIKSGLDTLIQGMEKVILLYVPAGFPVQLLLCPAAQRLLDAGFDLETYYCPIDPAKKLEHILVPDAGLAIISCNEYHTAGAGESGQKRMEIRIDPAAEEDPLLAELRMDLSHGVQEDLSKALEVLRKTRQIHDELESYYIPYMDFAAIEKTKQELIAKIQQM